jgi:hypothetical protein
MGPDQQNEESHQIFGIDLRKGKRPPWWVWPIIGLITIWLTYALADGLRDGLTTTEQERVARTVTDFAVAFADGDGTRVCDLITKGSQLQEIALAEQGSTRKVDCPTAVEFDLTRSQALGADFGDAADIDPAAVEGDVRVVGNVATLEADEDLTTSTLAAEKVGGTWLLDLTKSEVVPGGDVPGDASADDLRAAADQVCRSGFTRSALDVTRLASAAKSRDRVAFEDSARNWSRSEAQLADDLDRFSGGAADASIDPLVEALREEARTIEALAAGPVSKARFGPVGAASRKVTQVAEDGGFDRYGCAAPAGPGPRPTA